MKTLAMIAAVVVGTFAVLFVGSGLLLAGAIATSGLVTVSIEEKGPDGMDVYVPVPAALVGVGIDLARIADDGRELDHVRRELGDWGPAVLAACEALEDSPDAVLVEVQDGHETVRVVKRGGALEVRVESADADISVRLPARLLTRLLGEIA